MYHRPPSNDIPTSAPSKGGFAGSGSGTNRPFSLEQPIATAMSRAIWFIWFAGDGATSDVCEGG
jgi:hypothetical protein